MPLDKDLLGTQLFNARNAFNEKTMDELIAEYGDLDGVRLAACKMDAEVFINHIKANALVPALGLAAPNGPVTGTAKIT